MEVVRPAWILGATVKFEPTALSCCSTSRRGDVLTQDEKELAKIGAEAVLKPFATLIERLFGGFVDEVGGMWQESLRVRRLARRVRLYEKLKRRIAALGVDPQEIPEKIWMPALQAVSSEDDETLQDKWAGLLATAANPETAGTVLPAFAEVLRQLSPEEARFLDAIYSDIVRKVSQYKSMPDEQRPDKHPAKYVGTFDDLFALSARSTRQEPDLPFRFSVVLANLVRLGFIREPNMGQDSYRFTAFSIAFAEAVNSFDDDRSE
jgi:nitroreductase